MTSLTRSESSSASLSHLEFVFEPSKMACSNGRTDCCYPPNITHNICLGQWQHGLMEYITSFETDKIGGAIGLLQQHQSRGELDFLDPCYKYRSPLLLAVEKACLPEHNQLIDVFLDNQKASVNFPAPNGVTPLMVAAFDGKVEVCRMLIEKMANVHALVTGNCIFGFKNALDAAMYNIVHLKVNEEAKQDRYVNTAVLLIQQRAKFCEPLLNFHRSNFVASIIPLLDLLLNDPGSRANCNIHWESLMDVIINMPTTHNIMKELLENTAVDIMIWRGYVMQTPLSIGYFFPKQSVFHLAACKGFNSYSASHDN